MIAEVLCLLSLDLRPQGLESVSLFFSRLSTFIMNAASEA